jgi:DNA-binding transcriptional MocR family regulator
MPKRVTAFEFMLPARGPETPAYRWIYAALRSEILEGRLRPGVRLPSTRDLASQYKLSRGTIVTAFEQLKATSTATSVREAMSAKCCQSNYCRSSDQIGRRSEMAESCQSFAAMRDRHRETFRNTAVV